MASPVVFVFTFFVMAISTAKAQNNVEAFGSSVDLPVNCQHGSEDKNSYYFCPEKPANYPQGSIDEFIRELKKLKASSNAMEIQRDFNKDPDCSKEEERNCCTESKVEMPYFVRSEDKMKLVIQSEFFQQTIKVTQCANPGGECFSDLMLFESFGYRTKCMTDYGTTKILVFNSATNETETVPATFPVSCSCVIVKD